jgi:hypothetical protein
MNSAAHPSQPASKMSPVRLLFSRSRERATSTTDEARATVHLLHCLGRHRRHTECRQKASITLHLVFGEMRRSSAQEPNAPSCRRRRPPPHARRGYTDWLETALTRNFGRVKREKKKIAVKCWSIWGSYQVSAISRQPSALSHQRFDPGAPGSHRLDVLTFRLFDLRFAIRYRRSRRAGIPHSPFRRHPRGVALHYEG